MNVIFSTAFFQKKVNPESAFAGYQIANNILGAFFSPLVDYIETFGRVAAKKLIYNLLGLCFAINIVVFQNYHFNILIEIFGKGFWIAGF